MTEYIKREDAIKTVCDCVPHSCDISSCGFGCAEAEALSKLPAEDVRPVVYAAPVRFYDYPFTGRLLTTCSRCDQKVSQKDAYCRHCGASFLREVRKND